MLKSKIIVFIMICANCKKTIDYHGHMCAPLKFTEKTLCAWCAKVIEDESHCCSWKADSMIYICTKCGKTAVSDKFLCYPKKIEPDKK